jgi:hypothetical protein
MIKTGLTIQKFVIESVNSPGSRFTQKQHRNRSFQRNNLIDLMDLGKEQVIK